MRTTLAAWVFPLLLATGCCCRRDPCPCPCGPVSAPMPPPPPAATVAVAPAAAPASAAPALAAPAPARVEAAAPKKDEAIHETLKQKKIKDVEFHDASLDQVAQYLQAMTGVPVEISDKARASKASNIRISIPRQPELCCAEVLDVVTAPWELAWTVQGGTIHIETKDEAAATSR